ncbi:hypothetical protein [Labrys wisconsinensis]|uniref:Uncharacterized protein n=1 Tax=Labrys wisconsinensis TaxID=425677 RepID=A0ABU0J082_9HYPH|nr:hypothetical protein [Labrys wisconsinensis]MDQ0467682.1 hypothetical protein [Labrys wisconsinensis]
MALAGAGVVAIWNDITDEGRANFYEWHNREHMPERVGIDGFLRGRRYVAEPGEGDPLYFTLYEVRNPAVLSGSAYRARLDAPTPWTRESVRHFRNVARSLCTTEWSRGAGSGGFLGTLRFDSDPAADERTMQRLTTALQSLSETPGLVSAHVCRADVGASTAKTAEQAGRPENAVPRWVVMLEGTVKTAVREALAGPLGDGVFGDVLPLGAARGLYSLQFDILSGCQAPAV